MSLNFYVFFYLIKAETQLSIDDHEVVVLTTCNDHRQAIYILVMTLGKSFACMCLSHLQYYLVLV